eukprot:371709-Amphidinium_carterae.1
MLMPNHIAGAIIGKDGKNIGEIEKKTNCELQVSASGQHYPGTNDRIIVMGGQLSGLEECVRMVLEKLCPPGPQTGRQLLTKIAVPSSAVSMIIGHHGEAVKRTSCSTSCKINVSSRVKGFQERIVLIAGESDNLIDAVLQICREIQRDTHLKEHVSSSYSVTLPLGVWSGEKAKAAEPDVPIIRPSDGHKYTKRDLIKYLHSAAPRDILMKYSLLGNIKNTVKGNSTANLLSAVKETFEIRSAEGDVQIAPAPPESAASPGSVEHSTELQPADSVHAIPPAAAITAQPSEEEIETPADGSKHRREDAGDVRRLTESPASLHKAEPKNSFDCFSAEGAETRASTSARSQQTPEQLAPRLCSRQCGRACGSNPLLALQRLFGRE